MIEFFKRNLAFFVLVVLAAISHFVLKQPLTVIALVCMAVLTLE